MKLSESIRTERGVSPVIGVILMVAITVILAAVIGSFVLGIGGDIEKAPQASLEFDSATGEIVHNGGDTLENVTIKGPNGNIQATIPGTETELGPGETLTVPSGSTAGSYTVIDNSSDNVIAEGELSP